MNRPHDIGLISVNRIPVGIPHNRLGCQMEYDLWLHLPKYLFQMLQITDIPGP